MQNIHILQRMIESTAYNPANTEKEYLIKTIAALLPFYTFIGKFPAVTKENRVIFYKQAV